MHFSNTFGKSFDMREVFTEKELILPLFLSHQKVLGRGLLLVQVPFLFNPSVSSTLLGDHLMLLTASSECVEPKRELQATLEERI